MSYYPPPGPPPGQGQPWEYQPPPPHWQSPPPPQPYQGPPYGGNQPYSVPGEFPSPQPPPQPPRPYVHAPSPQPYGGPPPQPYGGPPPQPYGAPSPQPYGRPPPSPSYGQSPPPQPPRPPSQHLTPYGGVPASPRPSSPNLPPRPPQESQHFGPGAPSNYRFQYSTCTGRRKALLIGINYIGQPNALKGCINDVANMSTFLTERFQYRREDMVILTDDQPNPLSQPTKANILRAMHWLVQGAEPNDSLFIHFSGHGGRTPDLDGDEEDGYDDVIYPLDYRTAGHIVDDDMHAIMVRPLKAGVRLTAIYDSCHSGTALDLPYIYSTQGVLKEPNLAKEAAQDLFSVLTSYSQNDFSGIASTAINFFKKATNGGEARSKDTQTSADTFQDGQARGALSWAFIKSLKQWPHQSYLQLLNSIRAELEGKYSQKPQLSCSHPLDVNLRFVM
ncbi:hypothetical protein N7468_009459 [Penicillium chermesinum]|uniref:Metacaspase-1B n=1 Tax=Penicillium chermesinum TaxID=63820 RepID=A0A9W9NHV2_9EURO|nr:uncharacterized protein N7468_009459 [Penicillium chermesinum]KAJ5220255.1 hypothetical protein N7468_009459 [Penicillium chermesinum]